MKILLTGTTGYIATRLEKWLTKKSNQFELRRVSVRSFSNSFQIPEATDVLIHTAALVHKKELTYTEKDYFDVNCFLTLQLAQKAKNAGVKHFIFLSTMAVYGVDGLNGCTTEIVESTPLDPTTMYGTSKLAAERELMKLSDENYVISIIRPPMVYGPSCPGNYELLSKIAKKMPIFPLVQNKRSMIFIDNLTEFMWQLIINRDGGIFHPQDREYIQTSDMVKEIANVHGRKVLMNRLSGSLLMMMFRKKSIVLKVFGNLTYSKQLSQYRDNSYQVTGFNEAIRISELEQ